ncbi:hypothetical protein [Bacillus sp. T33-2]|uniref:hypothetical protein n=1 Tax=Bacillus sp. T33-2 TaxID=2054168 RepID=UPI000C78AAA3|nr:hypothetical protein [Bacillus sp. T33-2]PLR99479.1 hypothetical protein CVD19_00010 [Bacillus sp. T33-2]
MAKNPGKEFEEDLKKSAKDQNIFFYRIKDVSPMMLKPDARVSKNDFDSFIYRKPNLFPVELKSTAQKSFSFSEKIIKKHQIQALKEAVEYDGLIAGFIFNFRNYENFTVFVHINDFLDYKYVAQNKITRHNYISKVNKSSISLDICKEIGIEIKNFKKKVRYTYYINQLLDELIEKYRT